MNIAERQQVIAAQPRPRRVILSRRGRSWLTILSGVIVVVELLAVASVTRQWLKVGPEAMHSIGFAIALLTPISPFVFSSGLRNQRMLLRTGEVAVATVTWSSGSPSGINRNDDTRTLRYSFRDRDGGVHEAITGDGTLLLRENSAMLVFYDPESASNNVPQCATYYKVVAPGLDHDFLDEAD